VTARPVHPAPDLQRQLDALVAPVTTFERERPSDRGCRHSAQSWYIDRKSGVMGCDDCDDEARTATDGMKEPRR
jgi:hypothetical protein